MLYLDTSAALKLVVTEPETARLELWMAERAGIPRVSSRLLRIEMWRAVTRAAPHRISRANVVLSAIALLSMDDVAPTAEVIGDTTLRSPDAIHLATAHESPRLTQRARRRQPRGAPNWVFCAHRSWAVALPG